MSSLVQCEFGYYTNQTRFKKSFLASRHNENGEEQTIRDAGGQGGQLVGQDGQLVGQGGQLGGGLGLTFGQGVREVVKNVPETVRESVRELLSGRK